MMRFKYAALFATLLVRDPAIAQQGRLHSDLSLQSEQVAFERAERLPGEQKVLAFRKVARESHEEIATRAVLALIALQDNGLPEVAARVLPTITLPRHLAMLMDKAYVYRARWLMYDIARATLSRELEKSLSRLSSGTGKSSYPEEELLILAESSAGLDKKLILDTWQPENNSLISWVALSGARVANKLALGSQVWLENQKVLESVLNNMLRPDSVRLAAAAAVMDVNGTASGYFLNNMNEFLTTFGSRDGVLVVRSLGTKDGITSAERAMFGVLGVLKFVGGRDVEELVFRHMVSRNIWQNRILGLIAAVRWPERLIRESSGANDERRRILAVLSVLHPALKNKVSLLVTQAELIAHLSAIDKMGINGFVSSPFDANLIVF